MAHCSQYPTKKRNYEQSRPCNTYVAWSGAHHSQHVTTDRGCAKWERHVITAGSGNQCSCKGTYEGMSRIPRMINKGYFICDKVKEGQQAQCDEKPITSDESQIRIHCVHVEPTC